MSPPRDVRDVSMTETYDLLIVGGGINGTAIARDAAGRGLSVLLCEKDDLANHTSSASTKLIHGGLRYLEYYEFRLVRESLKEREVLLRSAPHIIWPLKFILPIDKGMRPAWLLRLGLFIYDYIGGRKTLPPTRSVNLHQGRHKGLLEPRLKKGFEYSDCWVEDSRLVVLNAVDARAKGAKIETRAEIKTLKEAGEYYHAEIHSGGHITSVKAKAVVNAAGPWVDEVLNKVKPGKNEESLRLVKGSHIVTKKLYEGDHAYIFQNEDDRIIFAIPYEDDYTLIGTTDVPHETDPSAVSISDEEIHYLCECAAEYFETEITSEQVVWTYSGIRPLFDDKSEDASAVTRDYVLDISENTKGAPLLSVYGGKITTSRKLAEHALEKLEPYFSSMKEAWTREAYIPGGDIPQGDYQAFIAGLYTQYSDIPQAYLRHLAQAYGTCVHTILSQGESVGTIFGHVMSEAEAHYLVRAEFAKTTEDILWRRTKAGLHLTPEETLRFTDWFNSVYG
jgi:glycerol-3-phosphate dehydrogenase